MDKSREVPVPKVGRKRRRGRRSQQSNDAPWNAQNLPYATNYNDHFETPLQAYEDLEIVLKILAESQNLQSHQEFSIYDPYFCNGRTKVLLEELGYSKVVHEKRDFYEDIHSDSIPPHDILVTNPPYSDEHKQKCFDFCFNSGKPFCLLLPNYVASRNYFRTLVDERCQSDDTASIEQTKTHHMLYLVPSQTYHYDHPEGTGHTSSPFESLWFCGIPTSMISDQDLKKECSKVPHNLQAKLWTSWSDVVHHQGLTRKRPNSHQRKAQRKRLMAAQKAGIDGKEFKDDIANRNSQSSDQSQSKDSAVKDKRAKKSSKYRDEQGKRKKKRF